ncbi:BREX-1 system adenine-specific DNA-methyltransferase PglX, partial [Desulfobacter sp.]|uniref:BREX-1 system adenine-specific DNA-methyltransferase PglX n=1 Tax=Desulfobacter sp. TaxID=2294 RepID=UPI00257AA568
IYGLDIDDRAAQLACFAVLMRARDDDRRLFSRDNLTLNIMSIVETKGIDKDKLLDAVSKQDGGKDIWIWIQELVELFEQAKTFGSLITIPDELAENIDDIKSVVESGQINSDDIFDYAAGMELESISPVLKQTQILAHEYDCVVANPPYMGGQGMNTLLKSFAKTQFPDSKSDLFAIFIERNLELSVKQGLVGMITMQSWMFLLSYEVLRKKILNQKVILSMIHLGARAFDSIGGEVVSTTAFVLKNEIISGLRASYLRLVNGKSEIEKEIAFREAIQNPKCDWSFQMRSESFNQIPGTPISYWLTINAINVFNQNKILSEIAEPKQGLITGDTERFIRAWHEVSQHDIGLNCVDRSTALSSGKKWFPFDKGGEFRKWFGNNEYLVNWENDGYEIRHFFNARGKLRSRPQNLSFYFRKGVTWTKVSSSSFSVRLTDAGHIFSDAGMKAFTDDSESNFSLAGFLNSKLTAYFLRAFSETINFEQGNIARLPIKQINSKSVKKLYAIAKHDWDAYEISLHFLKPQLLQESFSEKTLKNIYFNLFDQWQASTFAMKKFEEENNRIFIESYGFQNELLPDIPLHEITLTCNPHYRYGLGKTENEYKTLLRIDTIKELISYSIGCMMGRYNLDESGLIYAQHGNEGFDPSQYITFPPDDDGIIPIMDMNWFEDDATKRFIEFIKTAWPEEHLDENLKFVADGLNPKTNESPEDTIRRYLSTTFFKDHMKMYKKRPIYWLFSSGKQKAFECLVYLHRYNES